MNGVEGYMYPNEVNLIWSVLIVLYPYITGLVAGAFILASLVRVFNVKAVAPTYRLALLTALSFLMVAPLPLQLHLGHPERSPEMYFTPHATSAMAMFGFVYLWYLMAVLVFEIWLDYRRDIVIASRTTTGLKRLLYKMMTLGSDNISERSLAIDHKVGWIVTIVGIPSAFLLHGYVGFIFGSIKANPWWSSPLMPVVFIFYGEGRRRQILLRAEAMQSLRGLALHAGMPGGRYVRNSRWCSAGGSDLLPWLCLLRAGLPLWLPIHPSDQEGRRQVHSLLPPNYEGTHDGMC